MLIDEDCSVIWNHYESCVSSELLANNFAFFYFLISLSFCVVPVYDF